MYRIYNQETGKYLVGPTGDIRWTNEANGRIFKRKEDVRNFLRFVVGRDYGFVTTDDIYKIPYEWVVVGYECRIIVSKEARATLKNGII